MNEEKYVPVLKVENTLAQERKKDGGRNKLTMAVERGNRLESMQLLNSGEVEIEEHIRLELLYMAVCLGNLTGVNKLIDLKTDVNAKNDKDGCIALIYAAYKGRGAVVQKIMEVPGIDANVKDNNGYTAFMYAVQYGHYDVVEKLLADPRVQVDVIDKSGMTALMLASMNGHVRVVQKLMEIPGIDVNEKNSIDNGTALIYAACNGHVEVVQKLIEVPGINVNAKNDNNGYTAFMYAAHTGHAAVVEELLKLPEIDVNARDKSGKTALMPAAINGHAEVVQKLMEVPGIDVNAKNDKDGYTALMYAACNGKLAVVEALVKFPGINAKDGGNQVLYGALMTSTKIGHYEVSMQLLNHACVKAENIDRSIRENLLRYSASVGNVKVIDKLLSVNNDNFSAKDTSGYTALMLASMYGHDVVVKKLLATGVEVDVVDNDGNTALIWAAANGCAEVVNELFSRCTEDKCVKMIEHFSETMGNGLHAAVASGNYSVFIEVLPYSTANVVNKKCNLNDSENGYTPLHMAAERFSENPENQHKIIEGLLNHPCIQVTTKNNDGKLASELLSDQKGSESILEVLKDKEREELSERMGCEIILEVFCGDKITVDEAKKLRGSKKKKRSKGIVDDRQYFIRRLRGIAHPFYKKAERGVDSSACDTAMVLLNELQSGKGTRSGTKWSEDQKYFIELFIELIERRRKKLKEKEDDRRKIAQEKREKESQNHIAASSEPVRIASSKTSNVADNYRKVNKKTSGGGSFGYFENSSGSKNKPNNKKNRKKGKKTEKKGKKASARGGIMTPHTSTKKQSDNTSSRLRARNKPAEEILLQRPMPSNIVREMNSAPREKAIRGSWQETINSKICDDHIQLEFDKKSEGDSDIRVAKPKKHTRWKPLAGFLVEENEPLSYNRLTLSDIITNVAKINEGDKENIKCAMFATYFITAQILQNIINDKLVRETELDRCNILRNRLYHCNELFEEEVSLAQITSFLALLKDYINDLIEMPNSCRSLYECIGDHELYIRFKEDKREDGNLDSEKLSSAQEFVEVCIKKEAGSIIKRAAYTYIGAVTPHSGYMRSEANNIRHANTDNSSTISPDRVSRVDAELKIESSINSDAAAFSKVRGGLFDSAGSLTNQHDQPSLPVITVSLTSQPK